MTDSTPDVERVAAITERLAVLLGAGVTPSAAWRYLADADADTDTNAGAHAGSTAGATRVGRQRLVRRERQDHTRGVITAAALAARDGIDVPAAMVGAAADGPDGHAWRAVAAAWSVAIGTGARLAPCLAQLARSQRALGQAQRDIDAALAGPRATAKFVTMLPAVGLLFGALLGFDTLGILFTTVPGLVCLSLGIVLTIMAWRWSDRMVTRALPVSSAPGLDIDLLAIALSSGTSLQRARSVVDDALTQCRLTQSRLTPVEHPTGAPLRRAGGRRSPRRSAHTGDRDGRGVPGENARVNDAARADNSTTIDNILALSRAAGIPAAELLASEAARIRRDARSEAQSAAAALGTRLMIPLGLCILPAFMVVGVVPLMLSVLSSTVFGFG